MRLNNHIAMRFLTDDGLSFEILEATYPSLTKKIIDGNKNPLSSAYTEEELAQVSGLWDVISKENQKAFLVTNTVHDKLGMLKVKRDEQDHYDWTVFSSIKKGKNTFILLPDFGWDGGGCLRIKVNEDVIEFVYIKFKFTEKRKYDGELHWTMFFINRKTNEHADHCSHNDVKEIYEFVYKLLCFVFLSDNEYQEVGAGRSIGTKKHGKFKNDLSIPVTIINSKWNVTVAMTDGFSVRGHFALRACGTGRSSSRMVYIQPFQKTGYTRKAANQSIK